jgi:hypothetical protein
MDGRENGREDSEEEKIMTWTCRYCKKETNDTIGAQYHQCSCVTDKIPHDLQKMMFYAQRIIDSGSLDRKSGEVGSFLWHHSMSESSVDWRMEMIRNIAQFRVGVVQYRDITKEDY